LEHSNPGQTFFSLGLLQKNKKSGKFQKYFETRIQSFSRKTKNIPTLVSTLASSATTQSLYHPTHHITW